MTKILLVDDEPDIVDFLKYNLEQNGYEVIVGQEHASHRHAGRSYAPTKRIHPVGVDAHEPRSPCECAAVLPPRPLDASARCLGPGRSLGVSGGIGPGWIRC